MTTTTIGRRVQRRSGAAAAIAATAAAVFAWQLWPHSQTPPASISRPNLYGISWAPAKTTPPRGPVSAGVGFP